MIKTTVGYESYYEFLLRKEKEIREGKTRDFGDMSDWELQRALERAERNKA